MASSMSDLFPNGIRVMVVDDDRTCLTVVGRMLQYCKYTVTACSQARVALDILRERRGEFDLLLTDVYMPEMDGFQLLEKVETDQLDIPVVMMSVESSQEVVIRGLQAGACFYLVKPIKLVELMNIWQHVVIKRHGLVKEIEQYIMGDNVQRSQEQRPVQDTREAPVVQPTTMEEEAPPASPNHPVLGEEDGNGNEVTSTPGSARKKARVVWTSELHTLFLAAVGQLGINNAVPKKVLELMQKPDLTRENIASHLQKYRQYLKKTSFSNQQIATKREPYKISTSRSIFETGPNQPMVNHRHQMELRTGMVGNMEAFHTDIATTSTNPMPYAAEQEESSNSEGLRHGWNMIRDQADFHQFQSNTSYVQQPSTPYGGSAVVLTQQQHQVRPMIIENSQPGNHDMSNPGVHNHFTTAGNTRSENLEYFSMQNVEEHNNILGTENQRLSDRPISQGHNHFTSTGNTGSFDQLNDQQNNNFSSTGGPGSFSGNDQHPTISCSNNYVAEQLGITEMGSIGPAHTKVAVGETPNNVDETDQYNLLEELLQGEMTPTMEGRGLPSPEFNSPNFSFDTPELGALGIPTNTNQDVQQQNELATEDQLMDEGESVSDIISSIAFDSTDNLENLIFQQQEGQNDHNGGEPEFDSGCHQEHGNQGGE